jgi:predicted ATPase/DNA-binding CsgD family transcriptional regulator
MASTNLPIQLTSFIGRERDLAAVQNMFYNSRLITLIGAGGSGKTRLAIQFASMVIDNYPDGIWLVELAYLREPALVPQLVAQALGFHPVAGQPLLESLLSFVRPKQLLLLLDNCEHLLEACAQLTQQILTQAPELRILATSREPLSLAGEKIYLLSGLPWPDFDQKTVIKGKIHQNLRELTTYDAVRLFVERAREVSPNFVLTSENASMIVEICQRLDGLPLAIELASARVNVLTVQEITTRLDERFTLLTSRQRAGIEPRHYTLRAAIDWSYSLLTVDEQIFLRRLAVFTAGCTLDMAKVICFEEEIEEKFTLDLLSELVDKSLLIAETAGGAQARYRLLETIREYLLEKLDQAGETAQLRNRHLDQFLARAEEAGSKLNDEFQQLWLNRLEDEHDNLRAALTWALESERIEAGLRIACAISRFWEIRGYVEEGMSWFARLLPLADERISPDIRANAFAYASFLSMFLGDAQAVIAYGRNAVALAETSGDEGNAILPFALGSLISGARAVGDYQTAFNIGEQAIQFLRESSGPPFLLGMTLLAHGDVAIELGDYETARAVLEDSLGMAREAGDVYRTAHAFNSFGDLARYQGNYTEAVPAYEQSIELMREIGAQHDLASVVRNLGRTCLLLGDADRAFTLFSESLTAHLAEHYLSGIAECLVGFTAVALVWKLPVASARLLAAATAIGGQRWMASVWPAKRMDYEEYLVRTQERLTKTEFEMEWAVGREMSLEQAIQYAQDLPLQSEAALAAVEKPEILTKREREVAVLIAQGKSNGEIAFELVLSKRTVENHVASILSKLGFTSRTQVVRWVIEHGLT